MKILLKICLSAALTLGITTLASAVTTYKWVDKDGTVHYSQQPPSNSNYQSMDIQTQSPSDDSDDSSSSQQSAPTNSTPGSSNGKADSTIKKQEAMGEAQRRKNCEAAKQNLQVYTTYRRFRDKNGKVTRMDDNERAKRIEQSKEQIKQFCQ